MPNNSNNNNNNQSSLPRFWCIFGVHATKQIPGFVSRGLNRPMSPINQNRHSTNTPNWIITLHLARAFEHADWEVLWQPLLSHGVCVHFV
jgi:hypothetical protein